MTDELRQIAKRHAVKVAGGSGVLIQPATEEYSYVLTARHVIDESDYPDLSVIQVLDKSGKSIAVQDRYFHRDKDCDLAVLRVAFQPELALGYFYNKITHGMEVSIYGYPKKRMPEQGMVHKPTTYNFILIDSSDNGVLEFKPDSTVTYEDIEGYSGCGIFFFDDTTKKVQLVGIESRMASRSSNDGHIQGYSFEKVREIVQSYDLVEIKPPYLKSFEYHSDALFSSVDFSKKNVINCIKGLASYIFTQNEILHSSQINPNSIIEIFSRELLTRNQKENDLIDRDFWVNFLELLFIQIVRSQTLEIKMTHQQFLQEIFGNYRLICDHEKRSYRQLWGRYIAPTSFEEIDKDVKIIIFSKGKMPRQCKLSDDVKNTDPDITEGFDNDNFIIDRVRKNKKLKNPIFHWDALTVECIEEKENQFKKLTLSEDQDRIEALIRQQYTEKLEEGQENE